MTPTRIKNVLFDLDGTLTDPGEGITRCYHYALERMNVPVPTRLELETYIGPPIRSTFSQIMGTTDAALIEKAVRLYRERFAEVGMFENEVYAGVPGMLASVRASGRRLFVATSKMQAYTERILEHFQLSAYFDGAYGSHPDGRLGDKAELIGHVLASEALRPDETAMVGDRKYDVAGAKSHGCFALGVTYGYGPEAELRAAGADLICRDPGEVSLALTSA